MSKAWVHAEQKLEHVCQHVAVLIGSIGTGTIYRIAILGGLNLHTSSPNHVESMLNLVESNVWVGWITVCSMPFLAWWNHVKSNFGVGWIILNHFLPLKIRRSMGKSASKEPNLHLHQKFDGFFLRETRLFSGSVRWGYGKSCMLMGWKHPSLGIKPNILWEMI